MLSHESCINKLWGFRAFGGSLCIIFTTDLSATVFSCCSVLLTEGSSPNLIGFSALFFICLTLSFYADSLAVSSLISFHLLDTIL